MTKLLLSNDVVISDSRLELSRSRQDTLTICNALVGSIMVLSIMTAFPQDLFIQYPSRTALTTGTKASFRCVASKIP